MTGSNTLLSCITLIGMPGVGKSTLGVILAKALAKDFVDTDILIQQQSGQTLQAILDAQGYQALRALEESVVLAADFSTEVIATGGSVVYSPRVMAKLKSVSVVVYLENTLETLEQRVAMAPNRGIASPAGQSFAEIYEERTALYQQYADIVLPCDGLTAEQGLASFLAKLT